MVTTQPRRSAVGSALVALSVAALFLAALVFLFGVVITHGVYGSRMAWFFGVCIPLCVIAAVLSWGASRLFRGAAREEPGGADGDKMAASITRISVGVIGIPVLGATLLLLTYGALLLRYWVSH